MRKKVFYDDGFAHVISRGVGKMIIFEDDMDYKYYIKLMREYSGEMGITVCAYCLMANHVHILLRYAGKELPQFMQKLNSKYAAYFNEKYDRVGHLFQGAYRMENVDEAEYFLTVTRYIIQNPEKAGICKAFDYRWSSLYHYDSPENFVDISIATNMLGGNERFFRFVNTPMGNEDIEYDTMTTYQTAQRIRDMTIRAKDELGVENLSDINKMAKKERDAAIFKMKASGLSIKQIERLTGLGRNIIQRAE